MHELVPRVAVASLLIWLSLFARSTAQIRQPNQPDDKAPFRQAIQELEQFNIGHSRVFADGIVPIHYLDWQADGIPLILLHGTYSTAHDFARFAPQMIEEGFRPISIDWYGHGKTPIPETPVTASDFSGDLNKLMSALGIDQAIICGHSRGGALATQFYQSFPNRVLGLVLVDGGSTQFAEYFTSLGEQGIRDWMRAGFDQETGEPLAPTYDSKEELFAATWKRFGKPTDLKEMFDVLSQAGQTSEGRWTRWKPSLRKWLAQDSFKNTMNGMLHPENAPPFFSSTVVLDPLVAFKSLRVPVVILDATGSDKNYRDTTPTEHNVRLKQLHPKLVEHIQVPVGHFVHRAKPALFLSELAKLKSRIKLKSN